MKTGLLACLAHERVDCSECLSEEYVPAVLRAPDKFELEREAYQRGFAAGEQAGLKKASETAKEFERQVKEPRSTIVPTDHVRGQRHAAKSIEAAILSLITDKPDPVANTQPNI